MRQIIQIIITNRILHDKARDGVKMGCIKEMFLILAGLDTKMGNYIYYASPTIFSCTKVKQITEEILLLVLIIFGYLSEKARSFNIKGEIYVDVIYRCYFSASSVFTVAINVIETTDPEP